MVSLETVVEDKAYKPLQLLKTASEKQKPIDYPEKRIEDTKNDTLEKVLRQHSQKYTLAREPSFDLSLKNDNSNSHSYSKYLNSQRDTSKRDDYQLSAGEKEKGRNRASATNPFDKISKEFGTPINSRDKEIPKISFSNDLMQKIEDFKKSCYEDAPDRTPGFELKPCNSLFQKKSSMKSLNFGNQVKEHNILFKQKYMNKNIHQDTEFPTYNTNSVDKQDSSRDGRVSPFRQFVKNELKGQSKFTNDNSHNNPMDMANSYEQDMSKFTARVERQYSNNVTEHYENRNDSSNADFILRTMASLENLKNRLGDSTYVSKFRDDTIKSLDFASSPELGKTKDTSAFSGNKLLNKMNTNKTNHSVNHSNSLIGGQGMTSKMITNSDMSCRNMNKTNPINLLINTPGEYTNKSKYLTDNIKPQEISSFAARIEAISQQENKFKKLKPAKVKPGLNFHAKNKIPTVTQLMKSRSRTRFDGSLNRNTAFSGSEAQSAKLKEKKMRRDPSVTSNLSHHSKQTFSSMCMSKERKRVIGSDTASVMTDMSNKKLKRIGSSTAYTKKTKPKSRVVSKKKKLKSSRNSSTKKSKKFVKNVKYTSPSRYLAQDFNCIVQSNLDSFRKQYISKKAWESKSNATDAKNKKNKKSLSKKRKTNVLINKNIYPDPNIKMRTIDLADSRNYDEFSHHTTNSYIFNVHNFPDNQIKKSATVTSLFNNQVPGVAGSVKKSILKKTTPINGGEHMDFYRCIFEDNRMNTQEPAFSSSTNLMSQFCNEPIEPPSAEMVGISPSIQSKLLL